jgi:SOS-response transcriptional repressor LexA
MDRDATLRKRQGERLQAAREAAGFRSARAAAKENDWPESTYRAHEGGTRTIGQDDAERYTRRFRAAGVRVAAKDILFGRAGDDRQDMPDGLIKVPIISWVSASRMAEVTEPLPLGEAPTLTMSDLPVGDWFALKVQGDSMDRVAPDGATLLVNRADRRLISRKFYVFADRGEATFKRFVDRPIKMLAPFSTNPIHEPIVPQRNFAVVGRAYRVISNL